MYQVCYQRKKNKEEYIILYDYNTKLMYEKINNTSILLEDWYDYKS